MLQMLDLVHSAGPHQVLIVLSDTNTGKLSNALVFVYLFVLLGKKLQGATSHRLFSGGSFKGSQSKAFRQNFSKLFAVSSPACTTGLLGQL